MSIFQICILLLLSLVSFSKSCSEVFEGFGVYLGSVGHFSKSPVGTIKKVFDKTYNDLGIRKYRTSYEPIFSPSPDVYEITCKDNTSCTWIEVHEEISKYPDISIIASIWSPPYYMKNKKEERLLISQEPAFHNFIKNITHLISTQFNLTIEKVSPVNEPENVFATWDHTNMLPTQLCRMVQEFNDPIVSVCPENSYFWVSEAYWNFTQNNASIHCSDSCEIFGTHAYALNIDITSDDSFLAYYDLTRYTRKTNKRIWQTEVSSTYGNSENTQMKEALDLSMNIVNFVGHTCIQRYYFWLSYTFGSSGESLIWGQDNGELILPKKYFAYKHFTLASQGGSTVSTCDPRNLAGVSCITFGVDSSVFVNTLNTTTPIDYDGSSKCKSGTLCCTFNTADWNCENDKYLPSESVCSCQLLAETTTPTPSLG